MLFQLMIQEEVLAVLELNEQRRNGTDEATRRILSYLWGFFTPPAVGADLRAALVASCLRGALPPVDLRAVWTGQGQGQGEDGAIRDNAKRTAYWGIEGGVNIVLQTAATRSFPGPVEQKTDTR